MPNLECEMRVERHVEVPKGEHFSVTYLGKSVASYKQRRGYFR